MKSIPTVDKYMTSHPHTIGADQPLRQAHKMMTEFRIRHLPVLDGGKLVGVISDRDLKMVESLVDVDPETTCVSEALSEDPFQVSPKAPLSEVCAEMATHRFGSVLIVDNHKLVGIFTWVDALKALQHLMDSRLKAI